MKSYDDIQRDGGSDIAGQVADREQQLRDRLRRVRFVVAVMSGKGGVGKSATTVSLATALSLQGIRTGIVDADVNGASVVHMTGVERRVATEEGGVRPPRSAAGVLVMSIDLFLPKGRPVEWSAPSQRHAYAWRGMAEVNAVRDMVADTLWDDLDILFVDLPPGTDKLPNLLDIVSRLSAVVVVTIPSPTAEYVVRKSVQMAQEAFGDRPIGLVENMSTFICDSCGKVHELFPSPDRPTYAGVRELGSIPFDTAFGSALDSGMPELAFAGGAAAAQAVTDISNGLLDLLETSSILTGQP